jgi:hypothetical protein
MFIKFVENTNCKAMKILNKQKANILIDMVMLVLMVLLVVLGVIIRYALIPGSERWIKYGQNVELSLWGMDRHQWGNVHWIIGVVLVLLLVLHLVLHWQQIVNMIKKLIPNMMVRIVTISCVVAVCFLLALSPFFISPKVGEQLSGNRSVNNGKHSRVEMSELSGSEQKSEETRSIKSKPEHNGAKRSLEIHGYNTISELSEKYHISAEQLKVQLSIPEKVSNNERIGRIRRTYDFTMSELEKAILDLQES